VDLLLSIGVERIGIAAAITLLYVGFTVWCLRKPARERRVTQIHAADTLVAYASQTGFAQELAKQTATSLSGMLPVRLAALSQLEGEELARCRQALFVVSTTGEGDAPDSAAAFVRNALNGNAGLSNLKYGVLALGDREYDNFCGFGHQLDAWLQRQGATPLFDIVEVDNGDEGALRHWQHQLSVISGKPDLPDWSVPTYQPWRLLERKLLNAGSSGGPCYHLALEPPTESNAQWHAGDIAEIDPYNSTWNDNEPRRPHREYSIASLAADGTLHLLVRQMRRENGELGLGSGWLTNDAPIGSTIALRIRSNENFHLPEDERPIIFIGNGTGIAGLRALIKARIAAGYRRNWLIFGERQAHVDDFYAEDIRRWQNEGWLEQSDLVFSRDQTSKRYVQHRLLEQEGLVREWISSGAAIYVCGSLEGMAPGVHTALLKIAGSDVLEGLSAHARYRRDVY
jgi:sulfite reductase (NADPH) flavoprotein alpha-component